MNDKLYWYKAEVLKVIDGDTIQVRVDLGMDTYRVEKLRLSGINTPEVFGVDKVSETYRKGMEAKSFVEENIGSTCLINTEKTKEKYGRYLARIYIGDGKICLNDLLIQNGLAKEAHY